MKKLLSIAIQASLAAGNTIMEVYAKKIEIVFKEDKSPLTQADKNASEPCCVG